MSRRRRSTKRSWHLDDAEARHRRAPKTFQIPSRETRRALEPGSYVKLLFLEPGPHGHAERMWVEVERVVGPGKYVGRLRNQPFGIKNLDWGDRVRFDARHVADSISAWEASGHADRLRAAALLLGGVGVLAGLVYLAVRLRDHLRPTPPPLEAPPSLAGS